MASIFLVLNFQKTQLAGLQAVLADLGWDMLR